MRQISIILFILFLATSAYAEPEDAVFAILKLSYNTPGETPVTGGICGTAFLINDKTLLTAHHVLNETTKLNQGFKYAQFWLLKRGKKKLIVPLKNATFAYSPDIDTTAIILNKPLKKTIIIPMNNSNIKIGDAVYSIGHIAKSMPKIKSKWINNVLTIHDYSLKENNISDKSGLIINIGPTSTPPKSDVSITNIVVVEPSFTAIEGMSGGPLLNKKTNKLVGLMSFGLPRGFVNKLEVYAISISELRKRLPFFNVQ